MLKLLISFALLMSFSAFAAKKCEVYGISDGPQKLDCSFKSFSVALRCINSKYYLNNSVVENAFHLEVEDGPTPLVFKTAKDTLTVTFETKNVIIAQWESGNVHEGSCQ